MFATLVFDRDTLQLQDVPAGLVTWAQVAGAFAYAGVILWLGFGFLRWRPADRARIPPWQSGLFTASMILGALAYAGAAVFHALFINAESPTEPAALALARWYSRCLALAGACGILAAGLPFFKTIPVMRLRRIFALAKLSFKEAIRRRVLYAFSAILLVFLFASWFIPSKAEDQVRTYVAVVFAAMTYLLVFTALLVSAFSIPNDIKQQTIHTIVTKPVERFEVVLGRFLGFYALMTLVLLVMTSVSLLYVLRGIDPKAAAESLKARVPYYGDLFFENTANERQGISVGREWEYRQYITGQLPNAPAHLARWDFRSLPDSLSQRDSVRAEFSFDVYRTTKGKEGFGVDCYFYFRTRNYKPGNDEAYRKAKQARPGAGLDFENELAEEYGYHEIRAKEVTDYATQFLVLPAGLFKNAQKVDEERLTSLRRRGDTNPAELKVYVRCNSPTQYIGMARGDFYLRLDQSGGAEKFQFASNFFKAAFGLWLLLGLAIGVAVCLSTFFKGVIAFLLAILLLLGGLGRDFIGQVASGKNEGGGPLEAMVKISRRELAGLRTEEAVSATDRIVLASDNSFRVLVHCIFFLTPDVDRYDLTEPLAEGFDISSTAPLLPRFLLLVGYLLPWGVLAFYLIRWREIASSD
jgi:ABC-type transport system involved in multi-copper enzyme maturation permease subunit